MEESKEINKKNKKGIKVFLILFLVLLLISAGFFIFMKKTLTADYFMSRTIKKIEHLTKAIQKNDNYNTKFSLDKNYMKLTGNANITTNISDINNFNNLAFDYKYILSVKDDYMDLGLNLKQNDALIPLNLYINADTAYIESNDLNIDLLSYPLNQNIFTELKKDNLYSAEISMENIIYATNKLSTYFEDALNYAEKETINNGGVFKYKYTVNNKNNDSKFIKRFIELIKNDDKLRKILNLEENFETII